MSSELQVLLVIMQDCWKLFKELFDDKPKSDDEWEKAIHEKEFELVHKYPEHKRFVIGMTGFFNSYLAEGENEVIYSLMINTDGTWQQFHKGCMTECLGKMRELLELGFSGKMDIKRCKDAKRK